MIHFGNFVIMCYQSGSRTAERGIMVCAFIILDDMKCEIMEKFFGGDDL